MRKIIDMLISYEIAFAYEHSYYHVIVLDVKDFVENSYVIYKILDKAISEKGDVSAVTWDENNKNVRIIFRDAYTESEKMKEG